ncbi:AzlC family ABC transporter permease [Rhizobium sp. TRM95796]|uniref:AzlC family ABC transporter permease n=1 Tax=Rhizobium sp. TRM95796 TaxID=2979862 RepID=UPI0021E93EBA|nr:AzlC family ABC transporter permease [Rhizobium sp. TRM95796]MCV3765470.1 AzlC family ABC transporter permease [Rhizobium sp. TRM95796]
MTETRSDMLLGARTIFPIIIAAFPIGLVFGAVAVGKGLSPLEVGLMSALVFAGGSQFVAMDLWTHPASWSALGFAALLVNMRHVLMGASLDRALSAFRGPQKPLALMVMADENWALAEARARAAPLTPAYYFGMAAPFYLNWIVSSLIGAGLGALLGDPAVTGLDFAFPALFIVLVMGFWKGRATALVLLASGAAAVVTHQTVGGAWHIVAGALAGLVAATALALKGDAA